MRGVPRQRRAISSAAAVLDLDGQQARRAVDDRLQLLDLVRIEPQHQSEAPAQRRADQALPRSGADGGELRHGQRVRARARSRAHQDIDAEIFQRRIEHLLHIRQQAMDLVDEEDLARADVAQDAGEIEFLLQHGPGSGGEGDFQLLGDDGGERGFAEAGRPVEQHVVHGFAALAGGLDGDGEILFQLALPGEIGEPARAQSRFELRLFGLCVA